MSSSRVATHCLRLGLQKPPSTHAELAAAYRRAALKHHPDRGGSAAAFAAVADSYHALQLPRHAAAAAYDPASLRSHGDGATRRNDAAAMRGIATVVVLPCAVGLAVGLRLLYARPGPDHLRAGGPSRFVPPVAVAARPSA